MRRARIGRATGARASSSYCWLAQLWCEAPNGATNAFGDERLGDERLGDERLGDERLGDERLASPRHASPARMAAKTAFMSSCPSEATARRNPSRSSHRSTPRSLAADATLSNIPVPVGKSQ